MHFCNDYDMLHHSSYKKCVMSIIVGLLQVTMSVVLQCQPTDVTCIIFDFV